MAVYATAADFRAHVGPKKGYAHSARRVASVDATANTLTLEGHGFAADTPVQFVARTGGVLPAPLSAGVKYYAKPVAGSSSLFQVATSAGGAAVDLTTAGSGIFEVVEQIDPLIERFLEIASREIDDAVPAHAPVMTPPYPARTVGWCCTIAEWYIAGHLGKLQRDDAVDMALRRVTEDMKRFQAGAVLRDSTAGAPMNLAIRGASTGSDPRGWAARGNGVIP